MDWILFLNSHLSYSRNSSKENHFSYLTIKDLKDLHLRFLSYLVIAYMLIAFGWWSVLLFTKNEDAFLAKTEYLKLVMIAEHRVHSVDEFYKSAEYIDLAKKYKRQEWMIFGEASVFILSLVIGIYLINRAYHREVQSAENRRNFLLSITHELKSPIASILLVLETFLKRDLKKEQAKPLTEGALQETERLNTLVNNLLLAARVETAYQLHKEKIDLQQMVPVWQEQIEMKAPEVHLHFSPQQGNFTISVDKIGLNSISLNLLENAIKYSPKPAEISVSLKKQKQGILIEFADKGFGIPNKEKKMIFDRFYRVGSEDTRKTKGTGLGLYIVAQMVRTHGGKIAVKDNPGGGTIFEVWLPE
ncbi:MAG: two-component system phosphate regulon sensor histidine kinase PhoR [Flavobacteriales bacterium]|jgi:two-component system phosphate regulon sensor histidine kinase PhoR